MRVGWVKCVRTILIVAIAVAAGDPPARASEKLDRVAFLRMTDGVWQVWMMAVDGSNAHHVTESPGDKHAVGFCPRSDFLWFERERGDIALVDLTTGDEYPVRAFIEAQRNGFGGEIVSAKCGAGGDAWDEATAVRSPSWIPSDKGLVIHRSLSPELELSYSIVVADISRPGRFQRRGENRRVVDTSAVTTGDTLAVVSARDRVEEVWAVGRRGRRRLVDGGLFEASPPSFSSDGQWLVFSSTHEGVSQIYRARATGERRLERLTHGDAASRRPVLSGVQGRRQ